MAAITLLSTTFLSAASRLDIADPQHLNHWAELSKFSVSSKAERVKISLSAVQCKMAASTRIPTLNSNDEHANVDENRRKAVKKVPRVLSVAGSDSGAGAGIQADLKACAALGVFCTTAITAITAQNTVGVQGIHEIPTSMLEQQITSVAGDIGVDVVKTGMLPSPQAVSALVNALRQISYRALVVDPVLVSTSGSRLAQSSILPTLRAELYPLVDLLTPNLAEAAAILEEAGEEAVDMRGVEGMKSAARIIQALGPKCVLVKGGHAVGTSDAVDVLYDGLHWHELRGPRISTRNTHGTGCTLAASIAAELAKGQAMLPAVQAAKAYLTALLVASASLRIGEGKQGPLNHLPALTQWSETSPRSTFSPESLLLYAVTDPTMNARWKRSMQDAVAGAIQGGATFLQIREKDTDTGDFLKAAESAVGIARAAGVPLVINDRVDIALAVDADGVHVGQSDMPVKLVRRLLGPEKIIGVSCKTEEQALQAWEDGADYIGVGGVYPTSTKAGNLTIGLEGLRAVCEKSRVPVVAIGGISSHNGAIVLEYGAGTALAGVAVVSAIFDQPDVVHATKDLLSVVKVRERRP